MSYINSGLHQFIMVFFISSSYFPVFVGLVKEAGKVRVDSWNLSGLVGGFLHFCSLRTHRGGSDSQVTVWRCN